MKIDWEQQQQEEEEEEEEDEEEKKKQKKMGLEETSARKASGVSPGERTLATGRRHRRCRVQTEK